MNKVVFYLLLVFICFVFTDFSCVKRSKTDFMLKFHNNSNKDVLFYWNKICDDTNFYLCNENANMMLIDKWVKDTNYYGNSFFVINVKPHSYGYLLGPKYCSWPFWDSSVKCESLPILVIDKNKLIDNFGLNTSRLQKMELTFAYLFENECTITFTDSTK